MDKVKILAIAPYEGLKKMMVTIGEERDDVEITAYYGDLEVGADIVSQINQLDYDVIISRAGTAKLISQIAQIPLVDIPISHYDILNGIMLAENYPGSFAIIGFESIAKMAELLCEILRLDIRIEKLNHTWEAAGVIDRLKADGYTMIMGDTISYKESKKAGVDAMLVTSGRESIEVAIDKAVELFNYYNRIKLENKFFTTALALNNQGVFVFTQDNKLAYSSVKHNEDMLITVARKMITPVAKYENYKIVEQIGRHQYRFNGYKKAIRGKSYTLITTGRINTNEQSYIKGINALIRADVVGEVLSSSRNEKYKALTKTITKYSQSGHPVLIVGENGSGKDKVARIIYRESEFVGNPCYVIDCVMLEDKGWNYLLGSTNSYLLLNNNTIYFKNINYLSKNKLFKLISFVENTNLHKRNRLVITYSASVYNVQSTPLFMRLKNFLGGLTIELPSLRERREDIPMLLSLYLNEVNAVQAKHLLGCDEEGMELLVNFDWPNNLDQFRNVVNELATITDSAYIKTSDIGRVLNSTAKSTQNGSGELASIKLDGSLEDINYNIVNLVLGEEGQNQTKTAKRLGISRTTLWRIINSKNSLLEK